MMIKNILPAALWAGFGAVFTSAVLAQAPAGAGAGAGAGAAAYPTKSVRIVVPATAGDGSDVLGRTKTSPQRCRQNVFDHHAALMAGAASNRKPESAIAF